MTTRANPHRATTIPRQPSPWLGALAPLVILLSPAVLLATAQTIPSTSTSTIVTPPPAGGPTSTPAAADPSPSPRPPDVDFRSLAAPYAGPGRDVPEPAHLSQIRIGYYGPSDPNHPELGDAWIAANLALNQANADGGYHGRPFQLVPAWSPDPWTAGAAHMTRQVYRDQVWVLIAGFDGTSAHLAAQVAAKTRIPVVSPASADRSAHAANVPWIVSLLPDDHLQAQLLARWILHNHGPHARYATLATNERDTRRFLVDFDQAAHQLGLQPPRAQRILPAATTGSAARLPHLRETLDLPPVETLLIVADPTASAQIVRALRRGLDSNDTDNDNNSDDGSPSTLLGTAAFGRQPFLRDAAPRLDSSRGPQLIFPLAFDPTGAPHNNTRAPSFVQQFRDAAGHDPDLAAAMAYDAVQLSVAAIRHAGLNRPRIGDALRLPPADLAPVGGPGSFDFDSLGLTRRIPVLGTIRHGRLVPLSPPNP